MAKYKKEPLTLAETFEGVRLTRSECLFIDNYMVTGNGKEASTAAGYKNNVANKMLAKDYIINEIKHRMEEMKARSIADTAEVMEYFTKVMRGEVTDQFGLEAPLSERTSAAKELAKRLIDNVQQRDSKDAQVTVKLDWGGVK